MNNDFKLMTFDEALAKVGASNYYQKRAFIVFGLQWFVANWILLSFMYLFRKPEIDCLGDASCLAVCPTIDSFKSSKLCEEFACQYKEFLSGPTITTAFEPILACENEGLKSTLSSMAFIGSLLGFFIFSFTADNYGRKISIQVAWFICTLGSICLGTAQNLIMVGMGIFLTGFGANPAITIHYSLFNEHTLGHFRDIQGVGVQVFYALGEIAFVGIAYKFPYWRDLTLYWFTIPIVLLNLGMLIIYESPKFVYSKSKAKGVKILNQIAKVNALPPINPDEVENNPQNSENNERVYSCIDLFRYASLRWVFVCGLSVFFGIQVVYYGISYASDNIGLDFYINNLIIAICECVAYAMTDSVIIKLKRRVWILAGFILVGAMAGSYALMPNDKSWQLVQVSVAGIMRFSICFVWGIAYVYVSELFPTVVRSLALGLISAGGTTGSILCSFILQLALNYSLNPMVVFGGIGLVAGFSVIPLRETLGKPLQDKIIEDNRRLSIVADDPSRVRDMLINTSSLMDESTQIRNSKK